MQFRRKMKYGRFPRWIEFIFYFLGVMLFFLVIVTTGFASIIWEGAHPGEEIKPSINLFVVISIYMVIAYLSQGKRVNIIELRNGEIKINYNHFIFFNKTLCAKWEDIRFIYKKRFIPKRNKNDYALTIIDGRTKYKIACGIDGWNKSTIENLVKKMKECKIRESNVY